MSAPYHTVGSKYEETQDLDIKEVAKLVRKDLKDAFSERGYKISVRIERYAGGQSLHVVLSDTNIERDTSTWSDVKDHARRITDQYNFDDSDSMSDYHHVRFYCFPRIES